MAHVPTGVLHERGGGGGSMLIINEAVLASFNVPPGMTWRWTRNICREVEEAASAKLWPGHGVELGDLKRSLGHSATPVPGGVVGNVRATDWKALLYHNGFGMRGGTRPGKYLIQPHPPKRTLHFYNPWVGEEVFPKKVWHPGFSGRPFLREAMEEVLAAHRVVA